MKRSYRESKISLSKNEFFFLKRIFERILNFFKMTNSRTVILMSSHPRGYQGTNSSLYRVKILENTKPTKEDFQD
jgi:hypothetical protein